MGYLRITEENIDREHICCAMSNKQSDRKKEWLKERFKEGLVFYRSEERGKCFIEYMPAENAWQPLDADGYVHINCLWVSGSLKGHGYSNDLLDECIRDAKAQGRKGLCILSSAKKKGFLADPKFLRYKGFQVADESDTGILLFYLPFADGAKKPCFRDCAKHPHVAGSGFVLYYSDQCPFTYYWVPRLAAAAEEHNVPLKVIYIDSREAARNMPSPVTNFSLFRDGKFITHEIQSEKKFLALAGIRL
ncbi:MAG: YoaP domain-containing protein [Eubacteriales bacterium]|nr:YoaP domain-containing protein [Eubacteriales bacterium]